MSDRHQQKIRRRSVPGRARDAEPGLHSRGKRRERRGKRLKRLIPVAMFAFIVLMIAKQEIPAVDRWWQQTFAPRDWAARQTCQEAALAASGSPDYLRIIQPGSLHQTENGRYLDNMLIGEMSESGTEIRVEYSCYLDTNGRLVKLNRLTDPH